MYNEGFAEDEVDLSDEVDLLTPSYGGVEDDLDDDGMFLKRLILL